MRAGTVMSVLGTATGRAFAAALPPKRACCRRRPARWATRRAGTRRCSRDERAGAARRPRPSCGAWPGARRGAADPGRQRLQRAGLRPRRPAGHRDHRAGPPGPLPGGLELGAWRRRCAAPRPRSRAAWAGAAPPRRAPWVDPGPGGAALAWPTTAVERCGKDNSSRLPWPRCLGVSGRPGRSGQVPDRR